MKRFLFKLHLLLISQLLVLPAMAQHYRIIDDAQGGDCIGQQIGNWDAATKTCTLTASQQASISIEDDGITLDGSGLMLRHVAGARGVGVMLDGRKNVVVRKLRVFGFSEGVVIVQGHSNTIRDCHISGPTSMGTGITLDRTNQNRVRKNTIVSTNGRGITLSKSHQNRLTKNSILLNPKGSILMWDSTNNLIGKNTLRGTGARGSNGINFTKSHRNEITGNEISRHSQYGIVFNKSNNNRIYFNNILNNDQNSFFLWDGNHNLLFCNDFQGHIDGVELLGAAVGNQTWWNNFLLTDSAIDLVGARLNQFQHPRPEGGNYWKINAANCVDANGDRFCDGPYLFRGNQDDLPQVNPIPWVNNPAVCLAPAEIVTGYEVPPESLQWDSTVAGLVQLFDTAVMEAKPQMLLPNLANDITLITDNKTFTGTNTVLAELETLLKCPEGTPTLQVISSQPDVDPAVIEFYIKRCSHKPMRLAMVSRIRSGSGEREVTSIIIARSY